MAIDKPIPNVSETVVEVPKQEELVQEREEIIEKKDLELKDDYKVYWKNNPIAKI